MLSREVLDPASLKVFKGSEQPDQVKCVSAHHSMTTKKQLLQDVTEVENMGFWTTAV